MGLFDRLEAGIERAVQGTFARHLRSAVHPVEIASNIRRAMDDRAVTSSGRAIVPNQFVIELSPSDYDRLAPDLENVEMDLVAAAEEHCDGQRYQPAGPSAPAGQSGTRANSHSGPPLRMKPSTTTKRPAKKSSSDQSMRTQSRRLSRR